MSLMKNVHCLPQKSTLSNIQKIRRSRLENATVHWFRLSSVDSYPGRIPWQSSPLTNPQAVDLDTYLFTFAHAHSWTNTAVERRSWWRTATWIPGRRVGKQRGNRCCAVTAPSKRIWWHVGPVRTVEYERGCCICGTGNLCHKNASERSSDGFRL